MAKATDHDGRPESADHGLTEKEVAWVKIGFNLFLLGIVGYFYCFASVAYHWMREKDGLSFMQVYDSTNSYIPFHWLVYVWAPLIFFYILWSIFLKKRLKADQKK